MSSRDEECPVDRWAEALGWYNTLRAAEKKRLTIALGSAWQDWYADPQNRRTFDDVSRLLDGCNLYRKTPRPSKAELVQDRYDLSVPIAEWLSAHPPRDTRQRRSPPGKWWLTGGLAIAAILVLVVLSPLWVKLGGGHIVPTVYQTKVGGLKEVHLPDGSSITLGGQTKLLVAFSAQRRSVKLIEGQAWFKVAHDPRWPFIVAAGDGTITDVGTAFLVTRESDQVVVAVTEGTVEVSVRPSIWSRFRIDQGISIRPTIRSIRMSGGEELTLGDNGTLSQLIPTDTDAATAWIRGRLTFDDQPLRYVIETVGRYSSRRILITSAAGRLRVSGIVFANDIQDWLQSLEGILPVTIEERAGIPRIQMRDSTAASWTSPTGRRGQ